MADVVPERPEKLAGEYGCAHYQPRRDALWDDLDAVCVCTPSGMHAEDAIAALEAGKHVVIEKPVDVTLEAADRLLEVQRATGGKVAVVSQHRFDAATLRRPRRRRRRVRPPDLGVRRGAVVAVAVLLRLGRLARHLGAGRWGSLDQPVHP